MAEPMDHTARTDRPPSATRHPDAPPLPGSLDARNADVVIGRTVRIDRPRNELYAYWRDFSNFQGFMEDVVSVKMLDATSAHWVVAAPGGHTMEWDSRITEDVPGERIAWASVEGASVRNSGVVEFRESPSGRGTFVTVTLAYDSPGGNLGRVMATAYKREPRLTR